MLFGHRPRTINRAALIVRPRQPYVDWVNSVDDDGPRAILQELRTDPSIYLVEPPVTNVENIPRQSLAGHRGNRLFHGSDGYFPHFVRFCRPAT